jgi:hypothetical protein
MEEATSQLKESRISIVVRDFDSVQTCEIQYAGVSVARVLRVSATHDYLGEVLAPSKRRVGGVAEFNVRPLRQMFRLTSGQPEPETT